MEKYTLGDRVILNPTYPDELQRPGTIVGTASYMRNERLTVNYVIELDQGFYDPSETVFVKTLLVHSDNMDKE